MLNLPSYSSLVGLNPFMPESSMRRLIYSCQLGRHRLRSATPRNSHMQRTQSYPIFPCERYEPLEAVVGDVAKLPRDGDLPTGVYPAGRFRLAQELASGPARRRLDQDLAWIQATGS